MYLDIATIAPRIMEKWP